jgi:hypothetical protein
MHQNGAINSTQARHKIVQVDIVLLGKWTHLGLINFQGNSVPPAPGFNVVGYNERRNAHISLGTC